MKKHTFLVTCFGEDRTIQLNGLIRNLLSFNLDIRIILVTDSNRYQSLLNAYSEESFGDYIISEPYWKDHPRYGVRNSNYWKARVLTQWEVFFDEKPPRSVCALDDDMRIVDADFFNGFELAERFGICLPQNPRIYACLNAHTEDCSPDDVNQIKQFRTLPALNISPMFFSYYDNFYGNGRRAVKLLNKYMSILRDKCCRGTLAMNKAMIKTGVQPLILPEQWCVGRQNAEHLKDYHFMYRQKRHNVKPLCLHWGQPEVREVFKNGK